MTTIEVRNVSLEAPDGRPLLDDVSMSVPSGSSGSGVSSPPSTRSPPMPALRLITTSTSEERMRSTTSR